MKNTARQPQPTLTSLVRGVGLLAFSVAIGCAPRSDTNYTTNTNLAFQCTSIQSPACVSANAGKKVFIGLQQDTNISCANLFNGRSGDQLFIRFTYSAWTTTVDQGGLLAGSVQQWVDANQAPMYELSIKPYRVCAFIDLNGNAALDPGEPIQDSIISLSGPLSTIYAPLTSWVTF